MINSEENKSRQERRSNHEIEYEFILHALIEMIREQDKTGEKVGWDF